MTPSASLLNQLPSPAVIAQAAHQVAWASGDHLLGDEWQVWRAEILGPATDRHPIREQALLTGQLRTDQPPPPARSGRPGAGLRLGPVLCLAGAGQRTSQSLLAESMA